MSETPHSQALRETFGVPADSTPEDIRACEKPGAPATWHDRLLGVFGKEALHPNTQTTFKTLHGRLQSYRDLYLAIGTESKLEQAEVDTQNTRIALMQYSMESLIQHVESWETLPDYMKKESDLPELQPLVARLQQEVEIYLDLTGALCEQGSQISAQEYHTHDEKQKAMLKNVLVDIQRLSSTVELTRRSVLQRAVEELENDTWQELTPTEFGERSTELLQLIHTEADTWLSEVSTIVELTTDPPGEPVAVLPARHNIDLYNTIQLGNTEQTARLRSALADQLHEHARKLVEITKRYQRSMDISPVWRALEKINDLGLDVTQSAVEQAIEAALPAGMPGRVVVANLLRDRYLADGLERTKYVSTAFDTFNTTHGPTLDNLQQLGEALPVAADAYKNGDGEGLESWLAEYKTNRDTFLQGFDQLHTDLIATGIDTVRVDQLIANMKQDVLIGGALLAGGVLAGAAGVYYAMKKIVQKIGRAALNRVMPLVIVPSVLEDMPGMGKPPEA